MGTSDHSVIHWCPDDSSFRPRGKVIKRQRRFFPQSQLAAFGRWLTSHDWNLVSSEGSVEELVSDFTARITQAMDTFFLIQTVKLHSNDKPWMSVSIKQLIIAHQQAFSCGNTDLWRHYKGKVKHAIQLKKKNFYSDEVRHLKKSDCRSWWKLINQLSGRSNSTTPIHLEENGVLLTNDNLVTTLNHFFLSVNEDVPTLDLSKLPAYLPAADQLPITHPYQVCKKLLCLNSSKAAGPDNIPPCILKDFTYELSDPLAEIFNLSLALATSSSQWKSANISPIPKVTPPKEKDDLRPISLKLCISKVLEEFVVEWILEDIGHLIDPKQFGCLRGSSTTLCLLDMFHSWLSKLDTDRCSLRIVLLDFSKAFDRINLNVLITKLIDMGAS